MHSSWKFTFCGYVGPDIGQLCIDLEPLLEPGLRACLDRFFRALRFTHAAVNACIRMNDEKVLSLVKAINGANFDTVLTRALNAAFGED